MIAVVIFLAALAVALALCAISYAASNWRRK